MGQFVSGQRASVAGTPTMRYGCGQYAAYAVIHESAPTLRTATAHLRSLDGQTAKDEQVPEQLSNQRLLALQVTHDAVPTVGHVACP